MYFPLNKEMAKKIDLYLILLYVDLGYSVYLCTIQYHTRNRVT